MNPKTSFENTFAESLKELNLNLSSRLGGIKKAADNILPAAKK